ELDDDGSFVYTPADGKRGKDYFGYKAIDAEGNRSQEATVIIKLVKCDSDVSYIDMVGSGSARSAMKLAECGAFVGKCIGGKYYFEPERSLTRGEFLSLCLEATGTDLLSGVVSTGFSDDDDIPSWLKSYVSTAVMQGIVKGELTDKGSFFGAGKEISRAEAMVILDRTLRLSDVSYLKVGDAVPTWAAQSAANLTACGIASANEATEDTLSRAEAADMLAAAMDLIDAR
ncbi:MAG: Ig-like domain-containing protein, partial [Oscillospiraceae bacterium]